MSRIVPSQAVAIIDAIVTADSGIRKKSSLVIDPPRAVWLKVILTLTRSIPEEVLVLSTSDYAGLTCALAAIETVLEKAQRRSLEDDYLKNLMLNALPGFGDVNPVVLVRDILAKCPDEYTSQAASTLLFVDSDFRDTLRLDISAVDRALSQGEWKAATVLAGSVVEALLLWAIKKKPPASVEAAAREVTKRSFSEPEHWSLSDYVEVALGLKLIQEATAQQVRLAKDFRNLIHPGRAVRQGQECNRGTALSAVSAIEHVVMDLTRGLPPSA